MDNGLPPNVPASALPDADFMARVQRLEGKKKQEPPNPSGVTMVQTPAGPVPLSNFTQPEAPVEQPVKKEAEPIQLNYQFSGDCKKHLTPVSTLTSEFEGKTICFAYCEQCKKNIHSQVAPIIDPDWNKKRKGAKSHANDEKDTV